MTCESQDVRVLVPDVGETRLPSTGESVMFTEALTEVPTIDEGVETVIDPEGKPMWTKLTDVYFPLEWRGADYTDTFRGFQTDGGAATAYVQFRAPPDAPTKREWETVHYGYVKQVGSGGETRKARAVLGDWSDFLSKIEPTKLDGTTGVSFAPATTVREVVTYVANRYNQAVQLVDDVIPTFVGGADEYDEALSVALDREFSLSNFFKSFTDPRVVTMGVDRTFKTNRHTLLDVINWLHKTAGFEWGFEATNDPTNTAIRLVIAPSPPRLFRPESAISIRRNNALFQLQPINELKVVGDTPQSLGADLDDGGGISLEGLDVSLSTTTGQRITIDVGNDVAANEYPIAVARYDPLYERSGGNTLRPPRKELKVSSIEGAKKAAKSALINKIEGAEGGRMILDGLPTLLPYDGIEAHPVCNDILDSSVDPLTYGARRVKHVCPATERYATEVDVGLYVDPSKVSFPVARTEVA